MINYRDIDFFQFASGVEMLSADPQISENLALQSMRIVLYTQKLMTSKEYAEIEELGIKNLKELLICYPQAYKNLQTFQEQQEGLPVSEDLKFQLPEVWSLLETAKMIENLINQIKSVYLLLFRHMLEMNYGKDKIQAMKHFFQVESVLNQLVEQEVQNASKEELDASRDHLKGTQKADPLSEGSSPDKNISENQMEERGPLAESEEGEVYTREELWQDELFRRPVPLYHVYENLLTPTYRQRLQITLGQFPFHDTHFVVVAQIVEDSPSAKLCILFFEFLKVLLAQKYQELPESDLFEIQGLEEILNDSFHVGNMQKILYVHMLIQENLARRKRADLLKLLKLQYRRNSFFARISEKAYRNVIMTYRNPIRHSIRETERLEELIQFMFQVSRANDLVEDVDLPPSLKRLPI